MEENRLEIEYSIIGSLLCAGARVGEHLGSIKQDDFSDSVCRSIFNAIRELFFKDAPVDRITVQHLLGDEYDIALNEAARRATSNLPYYIEMLKELAKLSEAKNYALSIAYAETVTSIAPALEKLNALMVTQRGRSAVSLKEALHRFVDRHSGEAPEYMKWGFQLLDEKTYCERGDFIVLGGYPSAGKTLLATQFALEFAKKYRVGFFSLETSADKLTDRMMSYKTQIPMHRIKNNQLTEKDWKACVKAIEEMQDLVLDEIPASGMTVGDIQAYSLSRRYDVIFIDYLQLVRHSDKGGRYEEVTAVSQALHTMAQSCGITVVALAQLARPEKTQKPVPPNMSSIKESGQIEQDADAIMLLYQEDLNDYKSRRILKIAKNKEGERGQLLLDFNGETQTLSVAKPTRAESYAAVRKACAAARRERAAQTSEMPQQVRMYEMEDDGSPLPF